MIPVAMGQKAAPYLEVFAKRSRPSIPITIISLFHVAEGSIPSGINLITSLFRPGKIPTKDSAYRVQNRKASVDSTEFLPRFYEYPTSRNI
jgi:hypothetical protein